ncbi:RluA family pseudouridine synthase [Microaceticoccus formicicus]|uniref:RluA family pseudouridine synthase n=1 Tax=Microaceticoccus formicicus TaxID=3118105 RepID=UPI003CD028B0|nr:RluA family pseudouridine synthase [Peptoniphilaceae bacterium AMB_02]
MREIIIEQNDDNQRLDRFLSKYLNKAPASLLQKFIRTKRIKVNKKRTTPDFMLREGDIVNIYIYDEVLEQYIDKKEYSTKTNIKIDYIYDDENISILYKPVGMLTHPASAEDYGKTLLDAYVEDLIRKVEYVPRIEKSFVPAFANRLDRNTSGMLVGCKNSRSLQDVNSAIKSRLLRRVYRTIVSGILDEKLIIDKNLVKSETKNRMHTDESEGQEAKTLIRPIFTRNNYSLVEAELITGRTHQIRAHLASINHPIIGDRKYGRKDVNKKLFDDFGLDNQYLIAYKLVLDGLEDDMSYLNGKAFKLDSKYYNEKMERKIIGGIYEGSFK